MVPFSLHFCHLLVQILKVYFFESLLSMHIMNFSPWYTLFPFLMPHPSPTENCLLNKSPLTWAFFVWNSLSLVNLSPCLNMGVGLLHIFKFLMSSYCVGVGCDTCTWVPRFVCPRTCACRGQCRWSVTSSILHCIPVLRSSLFWLDGLTSEHPGFTCLYLPVLGVQVCVAMPNILHGI